MSPATGILLNCRCVALLYCISQLSFLYPGNLYDPFSVFQMIQARSQTKMTTAIPYSPYKLVNGVYCSRELAASATFEQQYVAVRTKEARIYTDEMVSALPDMPQENVAYTEWLSRKKSAMRLLNFCRKKRSTSILEIGCGNGWLSNLLSRISNVRVTGLDINLTELQQAARVFHKNNLTFVYDDFTPSFMEGTQFSDIVFATSIQYFPFIKEVLNIALAKLTDNGYIHIIDTHFYKSAEEQKAAALRTQSYYNSIGYGNMSSHYFHHSYHDLAAYNYFIAYNPHAFMNKLSTNATPFPWIVINNTTNPNER